MRVAGPVAAAALPAYVNGPGAERRDRVLWGTRMLSGSALARAAVLAVIAGFLAGLIQYFWPIALNAPVPPAGSPTPGATRAVQPPRAVTPVPTRPEPPAPMPEPRPSPDAASTPAPVAPGPVPIPRAPTSLPAPAPDPAEEAQEDAGPRALALVDLNTATLAQLNGLRGGGNIGRAIVQRRPYTSVDQLLSKRVLSRATYERIRDQVTVQ